MNTVKKAADPVTDKLSSTAAQQEYVRNHHRHHHLITVLRFLVFLLFLVIWEVAGRLELLDTFFFSSPLMVISNFMKMFSDGSLFTHAGITL